MMRLRTMSLGLCVLVMGLTMFTASAAQAEVGANWSVNGSNISGTLLPQLKVTEIENSTGVLLFNTKGGTHVEFLCPLMAIVVGGALAASGDIPGALLVLYEKCTVLLNGVAAPKCKAHSPTKAEGSGEILTEKLEGLIVLDKIGTETADLVKIKPQTGKVLAVIQLGELCAIGESVTVETSELGGGFWVADAGGNAGFTTESVTHLIKEGLNKIIALGQPAKLIGTALVTLSGAHSGLKWSGKPA